MVAEIMVVNLKVAFGYALMQKRPSITTMLPKLTVVKQKRNSFEKMGRLSDGINRP
jgi:hypothetical protein